MVGEFLQIMRYVVSLDQKKYFDTRTHPQIPTMCILQIKIDLP